MNSELTEIWYEKKVSITFYLLNLFFPSGCLNGKGQAQTEDGKPDRGLLAQMEDVYTAIPVRLPETNVHVQRMYQDWLEGMDSKKVQDTLHTTYSAVSQSTSSLDIKW